MISSSSSVRAAASRNTWGVRILLLMGAVPLLANAALTLSPLQSFVLGSRLASIQQAVRQEATPNNRSSSSDSSSARSSISINDDLSDFINNNKHPTIVFPGSGGPDVLTDELQQSINTNAATATAADTPSSESSSSCIVWDWQQHRGSIATAAFDGEAVGEAMAKATIELLEKQQQQQHYDDTTTTPKKLESIHIVGISVGAFCANAMASALYDYFHNNDTDDTTTSNNNNNTQRRRPHHPHIQLTLLDPFCTRGLVGVGYGAAHFGVKADYAEHYLNTDDPVPSTNKALPNCYCVDITQAPQRQTFVLPEGETTMHCWPVAYLARHARLRNTGVIKDHADDAPDYVFPTHDESRPRGAVNVIV